MKHTIAIIAVLTLSACAYPQHTMKNNKTGQVEICRGDQGAAAIGGALGYMIGKQAAEKCKKTFEGHGFEEVK